MGGAPILSTIRTAPTSAALGGPRGSRGNAGAIVVERRRYFSPTRCARSRAQARCIEAPILPPLRLGLFLNRPQCSVVTCLSAGGGAKAAIMVARHQACPAGWLGGLKGPMALLS